jgi:hypothetical protein
MSVARLRLAPTEETRFPPCTPFFSWARLSPRALRMGAQPEDFGWGNLPVPPGPPPRAHATEAAA